MKLLKDYDITILYHIADALSRKAVSMGSLAKLVASDRPLAREVQTLGNSFVCLDISVLDRVLACVEARSFLLEWIRAQQFEDAQLCKICDKVLRGKAMLKGILRIKGRVCVPRVGDLICLILEKAHSFRYSIHSSAMKMYRHLRQHYWWGRMKRDIADFWLSVGIISKSNMSTRDLVGYFRGYPFPS
ncbi:uncharacterized protein LOC132639572 [Lycium barbarum]|uniref:uncharacterized protein LOC132639572 n=1 Tax=Lycium barbarum TaxID=112863 RepID=UPI00293EFE1C|nr:uncharacterized protein LOC132639572 [Lycium barbarum]